MANALEQTKNLFSIDDYNKDDISDKSKIIKALDNPAFGEFRSKEEIIDKAKKTGTGLLTGTLALPSDVLSGAEMINTALADYANSPTAMVLKNAFKEASDKYGRPAFDKWFSKTTGLESNPENVDQLVGEVLSPTGTLLSGAKLLKPVGEVGKKIVKDTKAFFDDMSGGDGGALATVNNAPIQSIDETSKLLDKTKVTKPIDTSAPIIPESEFINAKPTINKLFAGEGTETGKKQAAIFRELEAQNKYTPEELFLKTRVYRGDDGQLRWEISTADAKLKSSWEKSLNFKKTNFNFEDEFLGITVPEKADGFYDSRASMQLSQILDFPTAYKEYYNVKGVKKYFDDVQTKTREVMSETQLSPLRNLQVYWERGDKYSNTLGYYLPSQDKITLNVRQLKAAAQQTAEDYGIPFEEAFKLQVQSTLLHEVQHAIQIREGFRVGGDSDNFLPKDYDAIVNTNKSDKYNIVTNATDQLEDGIIEMAKKDSSYYGINARNKILREVENDFDTLYDVRVHKQTGSVERFKKDKLQKGKTNQELDSLYAEAEERLKKTFSSLSVKNLDIIKAKLFKNAEENIKLINIDTAATNKYYNLYGEREARLVQKRLEDRFKLNKLGGAEVAKEVESDTKFLSPKGDTDIRGRKLGQIGGFPADTKITPTKLMSDGTTFNNTVKKLKSANEKPDNPVFKKIAKYPDVKIGKDGLPVNILKNESGKPLILYYGDTGLIAEKGSDKRKYFQMTPKKSSDPPIKIQDKFRGAERLKDDLTGFGNKATFVSSNPNMASSYAFKGNPDDYEGSSLIPIYVLAKEVKDYPRAGIIEFDKLASKAPPGTVISLRNSPDSIGYDLAKEEIYPRAIHKATGQDQYAFTNGTQVFSALTGERLSATFTSKNVRNRLRNLQTKEEYGDFLRKEYNPHRKKLQELYKDNPKMLEYINSKEYLKDGDEMSFMNTYYKERLETIKNKDDLPNQKKGTVLSKDTMYQGGLQLAKGGVTMYNQMEMFQDGGLKDEGGTTDPVSGNDVPSGSTQEEVRDDIPAQLSEGEFVFPADVVRYLGLDFLMKLRQKAKAGLQRMEDMGQMGNSDEATLPDDIPFDIGDLDMEDEPMEMAQGGVVNAANGTFVNTAPNIVYNPSQFAGQMLPTQQYNQNVAPQMYNVPTYNPTPVGGYTPSFFNTLTPSTQNISTFENLVGDKYGQYDEMRKYKSESGMILNIPFKGGQPIYPIPEGYTYVDPDDVSTDDPTTQKPVTVSPRVESTQQADGGDGGDPEISAGLGGARTTIGGKEYAVQYDFTGKVTGIANVADAVKSGRATFQQPTLEVANLVTEQNKAQRGMLNPYSVVTGKAKTSRAKAISLTNQLNNITDPISYSITERPDVLSTSPSIASASNVSSKGQQALDAISSMTSGMQAAKSQAEEENNIAGVTSPSVSGPDVDVENISVDVETDAKGNADIGPNSHGFDAYGSGVADKQGTVTGIDSSGAISYSPEHDWGQPTQTTVDDKSFGGPENTSSGNPAANPSDMGLGSISTDNPGGEASDSCFVKGTKIKLYEGGTIAIEKLKKGNVILGIHGTPNTVLGMDIHKVNKYNRPELVKIEGYDKPFITASHPFYKDNLLMSFNNKLNYQYHPWLGKVKDAKEHFKYKKVLAKDNEMLYNLYLDGDHTHYANNLPVHNIVRNGHISFALFYKNYITAKQYEGDVAYVKGVKNRVIRLGYSKIAYPLAYQIMKDTAIGKITAMLATPFVKAMAKSHQENKTSKLMKSLAYIFVYPTFYLRGLIGR